MSNCSQCRKIKLDTPWDKFRMWWFKTLFHQDIHDEKSDSYTQGFVDGLTQGRMIELERSDETQRKYLELMGQHDANGKEAGRKA